MKGFEKGLSPSRPSPNRNVSPFDSVENDENDSSVDKLISKFEKNKIITGRHSTSGAPRKKILAEIKEIPKASDAEDHKNPDQELGNSPLKKGVFGGVVSYYDHASHHKDESSLKAYDPLTNLLSPRPQYLRYNPNRRREIVKRLGEECSDEELSAEEIEDSCTSPPKVCVANHNDGGFIEDNKVNVNQNDGGISEEDKDNKDNVSQNDGGIIEEDKDNVSQNDGGIIEEDNDNVVDGYEEEEEEEEEEGEEIEERGWCLRGVLKLLLTMTACLLSTSYICSMISPKDSPIQQAIWDLKDSGVVFKNDTLEFATKKLKDDGFFRGEVGSNYGVVEEEDKDEENHCEIDERFEAKNLEWDEERIENENEDSEDIVDVAPEFKSTRVDEYEHLVDAKTNERVDDGGIWLQEEVESSHTGLDEDHVNKDEASATEIIFGGEVNSGYELEMDIDSSNQLVVASDEDLSGSMDEVGDDAQVESAFEEIPTEPEGADEIGSSQLVVSNEGSSDSMDEVDETVGDNEQVEAEKSEWNTSTVVVASATLIVSTLLAFIYHFKNSRSTSSKQSQPELKQDSAVEKNVNQAVLLPSTEKKVEFLRRAAPIREAPGELARHIYAPTVELIGEIVVGQPSSLGRSKNYQMAISENECNATLHQKHEFVSTPPATEVHPTTSSTSYTSFTTEKKMSKKEGGQSREAMFETPVRRSNRIRNRSAAVSS